MQGAQHVAPFGLRIPEPLKSLLKESATRNRRSMNSEIVTILEQAVRENSAETKNGTEAAA